MKTLSVGKLSRVSFIVSCILVVVSLGLNLIAPGIIKVQAASGAVWTTDSGCTVQNDNHYGVGETIWLAGDGFEAGEVISWSLDGQPGQASSHPSNKVGSVAGGSITADQNGSFCVELYTIGSDLWGEFKLNAAKKSDNLKIEGSVVLPTTVTPVPTTATPVPTTSTPEPTVEPTETNVPTTVVPTTEVPPTEEPTTEVPTTEPTTVVPTDVIGTETAVPTTVTPVPTTSTPQPTIEPTETNVPTTVVPTNEPTTVVPTDVAGTETTVPTTAVPTTLTPEPTTSSTETYVPTDEGGNEQTTTPVPTEPTQNPTVEPSVLGTQVTPAATPVTPTEQNTGNTGDTTGNTENTGGTTVIKTVAAPAATQSVAMRSGVLIPVTGADDSLPKQIADALLNVGLALFGVSLVLRGLSKR